MKDILAKIIAYRFWIIVLVAAVLPLIGWAMSAGDLQRRAGRERGTVDAAFKTAEAVLKAPKRPNTQWIDETNKRQTAINKDVSQAWEALYNRQKPLMTWPDTVREQTGQLEFGQEIPQQTLVIYLSVYSDQINALYAEADRYDPNVPELANGKVLFLRPDLIRQADVAWQGGVPPYPAAWRAQEDVWIQRAILQVIYETNRSAKNHLSAPVQAIVDMKIAEAAAGQRVKSDPPISGVGNRPGALPPPPPGGPAKAADPMDTLKVDPPGRYVQQPPAREYKIVPIYLVLWVEQQKIPELLVNFANSAIPIEMKQVNAVHLASVDPNFKDNPDLFQVDLRAHAYLYQKPPSVGVAKAAAPATKAAPGAAPPGTAPAKAAAPLVK